MGITPDHASFVLGYLAGRTQFDVTSVTVTLTEPDYETDMVIMRRLEVTLAVPPIDKRWKQHLNATLAEFCIWERGPVFRDDTGRLWTLGDGDDSLAVEMTPTGWNVWFRHFKGE